MKARLGVGVDEGGPEEDIGVPSSAEESDGVVEAAESGVGALELEVQDGVVVESMAEESGVGLEKAGQ